MPRITSLVNSKGKSIPVSLIQDETVKKHILVEKAFEKINRLQEKMEQEKERVYTMIEKYQEYLLKKNKIESAEFMNLTLTNYSNDRKIEIKSGRVIEFDEKLMIAKEKIYRCLDKWTEKSNEALKALIYGIFDVDKKGFIDKAKVLSLLQYKIEETEWKEAMELIKESIQVVDRKAYIMFKERSENSEKWETINLNFSTAERNAKK